MRILFILLLIFVNFATFSQTSDSTIKISHFSGSVQVTNNGISVIPSFSLGKPAAVFDLSLGGKRLSLDPQLRFGLNGKPWSFIFWWRYKVYSGPKFNLRVGAHPAFIFSTSKFTDNGDPVEVLEVSRFLAAEVAPTFALTGNISIGPYYLRGHGFDPGPRNSHYLALMTFFSDIRMTRHVRGGFSPQVFYLRLDDQDGFYFASGFSLGHDRIPLSLTAVINRKIRSEIASKDFLWNVSLIYSFSNTYHK